MDITMIAGGPWGLVGVETSHMSGGMEIRGS
jgi:hypothetical protein